MHRSQHLVHAPRAKRRIVTAASLTMAMVVGGGGMTAPATADHQKLRIGTVSSKTVAVGARATITPPKVAGRNVSIRAKKLDVRRASTWVARGKSAVTLGAGVYTVRTRVTFRTRSGRSLGRLRTQTKTQTLRITSKPAPPAPLVPPAPPVVAPTTVEAPAAGPAAADPSLSTTSCDSTTLRKSDGTPWSCTFADEFDGASLDVTKWLPQQTATSGYTIGGGCFVDDPDNISVADGALSLTVRKQHRPFMCPSPAGDYTSQWTSGSVSTWSSFAQSTGRFEIRAAFPATKGPGHHSALWLFPKEPVAGAFPAAGEIDIAEMYSQWSDRVIPFVHYPAGTDTSVTNNYCMIDDVSAFHTYVLTWTPTTMTISFDGKTCLTHDLSTRLGPTPFNSPFLVVLTQGLGLGGNAATAQTPVSGTTKVDYVRVWK